MNPKQPLWLPQGSVRAIIAFVVVLSAVGLVAAGVVTSEQWLPVVTLVVGFYFASRPTAPGDR